MKFENDIFVSYAHIDDQALVEGQKGWISSFHRALDVRLSQLLGKQARIWRDPKLQGNDVFGDKLVERLPRVALLVPILSPRYIRSEWCLRELREFWKSTGDTGGMRIGDKMRVFKIVKTAIPLDEHPDELRDVLGYEFYTTDPDTGRARELGPYGDQESQRLYWARLDDLAHDLAELLRVVLGEELEGRAEEEDRVAVYLAASTYDLRDERDTIKRELQSHDYAVLPDQPLPLLADECEGIVRDQLDRSRLSVHLVGGNYGVVPEGGTRSFAELQSELAIHHGSQSDFARLIWFPPGLSTEDDRQQRFIERLQSDVRMQQGADLLQTPLEDFKSAIHDRLAALPQQPEVEEVPEEPADGLKRIYLICDQRDGEATVPLEDALFDQGHEVIVPIFDGDEAQVRRDHEENLSTCDGVLLYYGAGNELWLRRKLRELQRSAALGRKRPIAAKAIYVAAPATPQKQRLRTREAVIIQGLEGLREERLGPFLEQLS